MKLGYRIPLRNNVINYAKVFVNATNLLTITNYSGYDPEASATNRALEPGVDFGVFPQPRTFSLGVIVEF